MSTLLTTSSTRLILPTITTLLGLAGLTTGTLTLLSTNPVDKMRHFGLQPSSKDAARDNSSFTSALVHVYAVRDIGSALTMLALTAFWQVQIPGLLAERVARTSLGLAMLCGAVVVVGDAVLVHRFAGKVGGEVGKDAKKSAFGHVVAAVVIAVTGWALVCTVF
jgi:hypothetical protein